MNLNRFDRFSPSDYAAMQLALRLARQGQFTTRTNPQVGCVLTRDGRLVGQGLHWRAGEPHAEINALREAGSRARGATAYVTLEPCCHYGKTGPCADALIEAGVARVIAANKDPNPRVVGDGFSKLRAAGIECQHGLLASPAARLNAAFFKRQRTGLPWVRVKLAASLDARTALADGNSAWITGSAARLDVQWLRARACAVLSGADTVLNDDPSLTVRIDRTGQPCAEAKSDIPQPLRVIVDGRRRITSTAKTFHLPGEVLIATTDTGRLPSPSLPPSAEVEMFEPRDGRVDLTALMRYLGDRGINEIHCECGPSLAGALLELGLIDELFVYTAPHLLGTGAHPLLGIGSPDTMKVRRNLDLTETRRVGGDLRLRYAPC